MPNRSKAARRLFAAMALFASPIPLAAAHAQTASQSASQSASPGADLAPPRLAEIVVTANKRSEDLSQVPISISAYSEKALEAAGARNLQDVAALTPGVEFDNSAGFGPGTFTNISIRGVNSFIGTATTGLYVDDTAVGARITSLSYFGSPQPLVFDIDRVEVDRGPQGALFGAGAEGGAIRFIGKDPSLTTFSGVGRVEGAGTDRGDASYEAGAAIGGPLVKDTLGFRASGWWRTDGGYVDHVAPFTGGVVKANANSSQSYVLRAAVTYSPVAWLKITPSVYDQSVHLDDSGAFFEYLSNPGRGQFRNGRLLSQPSTDQFVIGALKIEAGLGGADFTSITSYLNRSGKLTDDNTSYVGALIGAFGLAGGYGNPLGPEYPTSYADAAPTRLTTGLHSVTEEARLKNAGAADRLNWTLGVFYTHASQVDAETVFTPFVQTILGNPPTLAAIAITSGSRDSQLAGFGQADYELVHGLKLIASVRVARTKSSFTQTAGGIFEAGVPASSTGSQTQTQVTPKFGVSYQINDANMVYVSAAKGYRVGGGNPLIPATCGPMPATYASDSLWSYEIGAKDKLMGGRIEVDTSVFHVRWSDIQQSIFVAACGFGYIANTGSATSDGFDTAIQALASANLTLGLAVAYTDAHFTKDVVINGLPVVQNGDVIGAPPAVTSPWNITASAEYRFTLLDRQGYLRVEDVFHSKNRGPFANHILANPVTYAPAIGANPATNLLNARLGADWRGFDVSIFADNLLNSHPLLNRYQDLSTATLFTDTTLRPLTAGASVSYRF